MHKFWFLFIAIPLVFSNLCVNIYFWSSHVEDIPTQIIASSWATGLTIVEFLFPAWAITHTTQHKYLSILFYVVGAKTAVFSILVFAMTIDNTLSNHIETLKRDEQAKIQYKEKILLQKEITHIQLQAAQTAINAANKYNEVDKISLGTMPAIKQAELLAEKIQHSLREKREAPVNITSSHPLKYLVTLEKLTGVSRSTIKITVALILGILVEASAVLSVVALLQPNRDKNNQLKVLPVHESTIQPKLENSESIPSAVKEQSQHAREDHSLVDTSSHTSTDSTVNHNNELALIARVRRDILMGKYGDIPKLSELPQKYPGTGLRFHDVQQLRNEMIQSGEAKPYGKSRMKLNRVSDDNE